MPFTPEYYEMDADAKFRIVLNAKYVESLLRDVLISRGDNYHNYDEPLAFKNNRGVVVSGGKADRVGLYTNDCLGTYLDLIDIRFNHYINTNHNYITHGQDNIYNTLACWLERFCKTDGNYIIMNPKKEEVVIITAKISPSAVIITNYFQEWHIYAEQVSDFIPLERFAILTYLNDTPYTQGIVELQGRNSKEDLDKGKEAFINKDADALVIRLQAFINKDGV